MAWFQGWEFTHLLRSLRTNERLRANGSDCSGQRSNCERSALVTHDKRATVSESLRSLTKNEWPWAILSGRSPKMSEWANRSFFEQMSESIFFSQKTRDPLRKPMSEFPTLCGLGKFSSTQVKLGPKMYNLIFLRILITPGCWQLCTELSWLYGRNLQYNVWIQ